MYSCEVLVKQDDYMLVTVTKFYGCPTLYLYIIIYSIPRISSNKV